MREPYLMQQVHLPRAYPIRVQPVTSNLPDPFTSDEVVAGVRDGSRVTGRRAGALVSGNAYPRCEIEVLREEEASEGIGARRNLDSILLPYARVTQVGVVPRLRLDRPIEGGAT